MGLGAVGKALHLLCWYTGHVLKDGSSFMSHKVRSGLMEDSSTKTPIMAFGIHLSKPLRSYRYGSSGILVKAYEFYFITHKFAFILVIF